MTSDSCCRLPRLARCNNAWFSIRKCYSQLDDRKFETNEEGTEFFDVFHCRLAPAIVIPTSDILHTDNYRLVVQCTTERITTKPVLLTEWHWEEQVHVIDPNTIMDPCFSISIKADGSKVLKTQPIEG